MKFSYLSFFIMGCIFVFPKNGLGTGLAKMDVKSPKLFKYMNKQLNKHFGVNYEI